MEWYTFGLDRILMFLLAVSSALVIVLAVMFGKDEKGPRKYIEMSFFFTTFYWKHVMRTYLLLLGWVALMSLAIILMCWSA